MAEPQHEGISDEDRALLRQSLRGYLAAHWPAEGAVERSGDGAALRRIWQGLGAQGLARLGADPAEGGLREILVAAAELGRASCPAPFLGAVAANVLLRGARRPGRSGDELRVALDAGRAAVAVAFGVFDGDRAAGRVAFSGGTLAGTIAFVEGVATATHVLVLVDAPAGAAIVAADAPGLGVTPTPGLAVPALSAIDLRATPASFVECSATALADVAAIARCACAARALGAAERGFELAVAHAKLRRQFGQFIGQFQAVQHKLADGLIRLDGARLALDAAAAAYDRGLADWQVFADAALAFAGPMLRLVALEAHHAMGAIGYAEEHELPRHFRRVHADVARMGGALRARAALADHLLGPALARNA
jgi:alkylation response protein AidB-like acyl-CoA dehydrogenase